MLIFFLKVFVKNKNNYIFAANLKSIYLIMKKIIFTAITILSIGFANAQENAIKANPLALLGGTDLISYERKVSDNSTASLGLGFASFNFGGVTYTSTGAEVQYRYYFEEALKKWYAGGQVGYTAGKIKQDLSGFGFTQAQQPDDIKYTSFVVGAKGGYRCDTTPESACVVNSPDASFAVNGSWAANTAANKAITPGEWAVAHLDQFAKNNGTAQWYAEFTYTAYMTNGKAVSWKQKYQFTNPAKAGG